MCGQSPIFLARVSRRANTICQPRKFCHLLPINGFKNSSSSVVFLPCPRPVDVVVPLHLRILLLGFHTISSAPKFSVSLSSGYFSQIIRLLFPLSQHMKLDISTFSGISTSRCTGRDIPLLLRFLSPISQCLQTFSCLSSFFP